MLVCFNSVKTSMYFIGCWSEFHSKQIHVIFKNVSQHGAWHIFQINVMLMKLDQGSATFS